MALSKIMTIIIRKNINNVKRLYKIICKQFIYNIINKKKYAYFVLNIYREKIERSKFRDK